MVNIFPDPIKKLPQADIPLTGLTGYILQGKKHQVIFMSFDNDLEIPEHCHDDQWEIVIEGCVDLHMNGRTTRYSKGDRFFIPKGILHSATVYSGYASIIFFNEKYRYREKKVK
jgi:quercetin dioxygenase-like cupin family protein